MVTSTTGDSNPLNNSATADTSILGYADLTISKSQLTPDPITAGSLVTYTIRITNTGPGLARNVDVKDQLPAGMNLVSANSSDGGVCGGAVCQFGTLQKDDVRIITVTVRGDSAAVTGSLTNTAAAYSTDESVQANNTATRTTIITTSAALHVRKVDLIDPVNAGETLLYQIVVNSGPSDAQNVVITDSLPVNTTWWAPARAATWWAMPWSARSARWLPALAKAFWLKCVWMRRLPTA